MTRFECPHCEKNCAERLAELQRCIVDLAADVENVRDEFSVNRVPVLIKHAETIKTAQKFIKQTKGD